MDTLEFDINPTSPYPAAEIRDILGIPGYDADISVDALNTSPLKTNINREMKSLIDSAKDSKIIKEFTQNVHEKRIPKKRQRSEQDTHSDEIKRKKKHDEPYNNTINLNSSEEFIEFNSESDDDDKNDVSKDLITEDENGRRIDPFCWRCHKDDTKIVCSVCPRTFHPKCLQIKHPVSANWACSECITIMNAENMDTRSLSMQRISLAELCKLFKFALNKMMAVKGAEPFIEHVNSIDLPDYNNYIAEPMYLSKISEKVENQSYGSTVAFISDVMWISHNSKIYNGLQNKLTHVSKTILMTCKKEMMQIENCPQCYLNSNEITATAGSESPVIQYKHFADVCDVPHIILWAKVKGFPYWPAKGMGIFHTSNQYFVHLQFFGQHDTSSLPVKDCFVYSLQDPNGTKKKHSGFQIAMKELELHIDNIKRKFGGFIPAPFRTVFDPSKNQLISMIPNLDTKIIFPKHDILSSTVEATEVDPTSSTMQPKVILNINDRNISYKKFKMNDGNALKENNVNINNDADVITAQNKVSAIETEENKNAIGFHITDNKTNSVIDDENNSITPKYQTNLSFIMKEYCAAIEINQGKRENLNRSKNIFKSNNKFVNKNHDTSAHSIAGNDCEEKNMISSACGNNDAVYQPEESNNIELNRFQSSIKNKTLDETPALIEKNKKSPRRNNRFTNVKRVKLKSRIKNIIILKRNIIKSKIMKALDIDLKKTDGAVDPYDIISNHGDVSEENDNALEEIHNNVTKKISKEKTESQLINNVTCSTVKKSPIIYNSVLNSNPLIVTLKKQTSINNDENNVDTEVVSTPTKIEINKSNEETKECKDPISISKVVPEDNVSPKISDNLERNKSPIDNRIMKVVIKENIGFLSIDKNIENKNISQISNKSSVGAKRIPLIKIKAGNKKNKQPINNTVPKVMKLNSSPNPKIQKQLLNINISPEKQNLLDSLNLLPSEESLINNLVVNNSNGNLKKYKSPAEIRSELKLKSNMENSANKVNCQVIENNNLNNEVFNVTETNNIINYNPMGMTPDVNLNVPIELQNCIIINEPNYESIRTDAETTKNNLNKSQENIIILPTDTTTSNINTDTTTSNINTDTTISNINTDTTTSNINTDTTISNINTDTTTSNINTDTTISNINTDTTTSNINTNTTTTSNINTDTTISNINTDTTTSNINTNTTTTSNINTDTTISNINTDTTTSNINTDTTISNINTDTTTSNINTNTTTTSNINTDTTISNINTDTTTSNINTDTTISNINTDTTTSNINTNTTTTSNINTDTTISNINTDTTTSNINTNTTTTSNINTDTTISNINTDTTTSNINTDTTISNINTDTTTSNINTNTTTTSNINTDTTISNINTDTTTSNINTNTTTTSNINTDTTISNINTDTTTSNINTDTTISNINTDTTTSNINTNTTTTSNINTDTTISNINTDTTTSNINTNTTTTSNINTDTTISNINTDTTISNINTDTNTINISTDFESIRTDPETVKNNLNNSQENIIISPEKITTDTNTRNISSTQIDDEIENYLMIHFPDTIVENSNAKQSGSEIPSHTNNSHESLGVFGEKIFNENADRMTQYFRKMLINTLHTLTQDESTETLPAIKFQMQHLKWENDQKIKEMKHNFALIIAEMRSSMKADKEQALHELCEKFKEEKIEAISETKTKQWCANCQKESYVACCWNTSYCTLTCQRIHKTSHLASCKREVDNNNKTPKTMISNVLLSHPIKNNLPIPSISLIKNPEKNKMAELISGVAATGALNGNQSTIILTPAKPVHVQRRKKYHHLNII